MDIFGMFACKYLASGASILGKKIIADYQAHRPLLEMK